MMTVRAFYKFVKINEPTALVETLRLAAQEYELKGTILVASEGINGTISAAPPHMAAFWQTLTAIAEFSDLEFKDSSHETQPFKRLKVRLKREIITMNAPEADPSVLVGEYVAPKDWNALISDPSVLVLDTRNHYEYIEGTFARAVDPNTMKFSELTEWVDQNLDPTKHESVAMFCTGGIRCEKASALMLSKGFKKVYHLKGGILKYLEEIPAEESLYRGSCFIFDDRDALVTGLSAEKRKFDQNNLD